MLITSVTIQLSNKSRKRMDDRLKSMWWDAMKCDMMWCDMIWYEMKWYDMIWYEMRWNEMEWHWYGSRK
jgi:hypothetical protein